MVILTSPQPLVWGALDVPLFGLATELNDQLLTIPASYAVVMDPRHLWFIGNHRRPASIHPLARPGLFQNELWKYDVAELFLTDPSCRRYFEFNLAPNGAWWSCEFVEARIRSDGADIAMPEVATFSDMSADGSWIAAMAIPLDLLQSRLNFGPGSRMNVAMILESPEQKLMSAADLRGGIPDFHQPERFSEITFLSLPE
jgi:hypothetical protein